MTFNYQKIIISLEYTYNKYAMKSLSFSLINCKNMSFTKKKNKTTKISREFFMYYEILNNNNTLKLVIPKVFIIIMSLD